MKTISCQVHFGGTANPSFSDKIKIPVGKTVEYRFLLYDEEGFSFALNPDVHIHSVSDFLNFLPEMTDDDETFRFLSYQDIYVQCEDYLLKLCEDKPLSELYQYFRTDSLTVHRFHVGGPSLCYEGYHFWVPSNDHNPPHVHVCKDEICMRYHLETLKPLDGELEKVRGKAQRVLYNERVEGLLKGLQAKLLKFWKDCHNDYEPPILDEDGCSYYAES